MLRERLSFILILSAVALLPQAQASNIKQRPQSFAPSSLPYIWNTDVVVGNGAFATASSPDNWLGGIGNWSNGADWNAGLPGASSDVTINTGNDNVTLDTSAGINSLTLGGSSGSSQLTGDGNAHTLTIAGVLTVNQSGNLYLYADSVSAGADSNNTGALAIEYGSSLQVNGNINNSGVLNEGVASRSLGNILVSTGTITNSGTFQFGYFEFATGFGGGTATANSLFNTSTGTINLAGQATLQINGSVNNSGSISTGEGSPSISVTGDFINVGTLFMNGDDESLPSFSVGGTLSNSGSLTVARSATVGTLVNQGQLFIADYGLATLQVNGNATNSGTIDFGDAGALSELAVAGVLTNNSGAQINSSDFTTITAASLINAGAINLVSGGNNNLTITGAIQNAGTIEAYDSATIRAGSMTNGGAIQLANNSALQVSGDVNNSGMITTELFGVNNTISIVGKLTNTAGASFALNEISDVANIGYMSNAGMVSLPSGTTLNITGGSHAPLTALPGFLNTGFVDVYSGGALSSALTYTQTSGETVVDGTLRVSTRGVVNLAGGEVFGNQGTIQGSITSNAAINIGDGPQLVGAMTFMGNYTQGPNGSLTFDIAGPATGQYDQLNISGHAQLNGLMTVDLLHGYIPQIGNNFDIMNFASESGTFSMVVGLPINNQEHFTLEYNSTNLTLDVVSGQLQGASGGNVGSEPFITSAEQDSAPYSLTASNQLAPDPAPEPSSILLFGTGVVGLARMLYSRR